LSFLLAPVFPLGNWGRQLVLGLIAALSVCGLLKLCERFGASARASMLITGLFGASAWWGIYAVRALPEVLGAGLAAWMMTGVLMERGRRWEAVALVSACAAALPWAYVRFAPVGLIGFGLLVLRCLALEKTRRERSAMAAASAAIGAAAFGFYIAVQNAMFMGGSAQGSWDRLFTWPAGMWLMMSDGRGIGYVFPAAGWLVLSAMHLSISDAGNRRRSLALLSLFAAVLATSCGWGCWHGGACVPGRYIVAVLPLLLAPAAVVFDRQGAVGRWWLIALLLFSTMHFALVLAALPAIGAHFAFPTRALRLFAPFSRGLVNGFDFAGPGPVHALAIAFYAITAAVLFLGRRAQTMQAALLAGLVAALALASWPAGAR